MRNSARASLVGRVLAFDMRISWRLEGLEGSRLTRRLTAVGYATVTNFAHAPGRTNQKLPHGFEILTL